MLVSLEARKASWPKAFRFCIIRFLFASISIGFACGSINHALANSGPKLDLASHENSNGFELTYLSSIQIDLCKKPALANGFREMLQDYYKVCFSSDDTNGNDLAGLEMTISELQKDIAENKTNEIEKFLSNMDWDVNCDSVTSPQMVAKYSNIVTRYKTGAAKWQAPRDCNDSYKWLFG